jgi:hypothetical protein
MNLSLVKLATLTLICFLSLQTFAQDKFGSGFYVTNTLDTVKGYIQYEGNYTDGIGFRPLLKASTERLPIDQVKSFGFSSGDSYARAEYTGMQNFPSNPVFIKLVVVGGIDLFKYKGEYFIGSEQKGHFKMVRGKTSNENQALKNYQTNAGIFNILFQDCPTVKEEAQKVSIREEALTKLLQSYHTCRGLPHREFQNKKTKRVNHLGFFFGESFSALSFGEFPSNSSSFYLYNSDFPTSSNPTFGVIGLLGGKGPSSALSIQSELVYTKAKFNATWRYSADDFGGYSIKQTNITNIDYSQLSLRAGLRITGRANTLHPYLCFGLAAQTFLSFDSNVNQVTEINSVVEEENFELETSKTSFGVWAGVGLKRRVFGNKALFLEANYDNGFISNSGKITALAIRFGFML